MEHPFNEKDFWERYWRLMVPDTIPRGAKLPIFSHALGCKLFAVDGGVYTDWCSQVGIINIGHGNRLFRKICYEYERQKYEANLRNEPELLESLIASDFPFSFEITVDGKTIEISQPALVEMLARHTFGCTTKIMKQVDGGKMVNTILSKFIPWLTKKRLGLAFDGAFHGRPGYALTATMSKSVHKEGFLVPDGIFHLPYPCGSQKVLDECYQQLKRLPLADIGYVIFELVQGEGGIIPADFYTVEFLNYLWGKKILLVDDDIQTGFGRTGTWFAFQQYGIKPDIVLGSKSFASGYPIAFAAFDSLNPRLAGHENFPEGGDSSTFQWNPEGVLKAIATIYALEEKKPEYGGRDLVGHGKDMGEILAIGIERVIAQSFPDGNSAIGLFCIHRKLGLHQGVEFRERRPDGSDIPAPQFRDVVLARLLKCGIVTMGAGNSNINPTIRFMPPLVVTEKEIGEFLHALETSLVHIQHSMK